MRLSNTLAERRTAMTVPEVAELLQISERQIYKMVADGDIPHFKLGSAVRFDAHMLAGWLRKKIETPEFPALQARKAAIRLRAWRPPAERTGD